MALRQSSEALGWIQGNINDSGNWLVSAGNTANNFLLRIPVLEVDQSEILNTQYVKGFHWDDKYPLRPVSEQLTKAGQDLKTQTNEAIDPVQANLNAAATSLEVLADTVNALTP